jgi:hypothetical protein
MRKNVASANGSALPREHLAGTPSDMDTGLVLDEKLNSAAAPFLYLLASLMTAGGAYLLYSLLHG